MSYEIIREIAGGEIACALVTVMQTEGSVPRHAGSKMLVRADGSILGTVGGGLPESLAIACALRVIGAQRFDRIRAEMHGAEAEGDALVCGGASDMIVEYMADPAPYVVALDLLGKGQRALLVKNVKPVAQDAFACQVAVIDGTGVTRCPGGFESNNSRAIRALQSGKTTFVTEESLLYDPLFPEEKLLILGAGHVGRAVATVAAGLGFAVTVADDRPPMPDADRLPSAVRRLSGSFTELVRQFPFDPATYVVIMTRGHLCDLECLRAVLPRSWRYAGLIGSARKTVLLLEQTRRDGFDPAQVERISAPIGLDIGAETPEEIAIAVLAEMIAVRRTEGACAMTPLSRARKLSKVTQP